MNAVFKKLQLKDQDKIYVLGAPREFRPHLDELAETTTVKKSPNCKQRYGFALFFVKSCADIEKVAPKAAEKIEGDGLLWFAYPKKSSPNYTSDISRDDGWKPLGELGFEGVRQVAIDDDWSALRFRHVDHIKKLTRDPQRAVSKKGKKRTK
jgi:hypothetical protein